MKFFRYQRSTKLNNTSFKINDFEISSTSEVYFIADIAANHDGSLERALMLINLAAESGAHAAKFQHFDVSTIISEAAFEKLESLKTHQSSWKKSVYQVYKDATVSLDWTEKLKAECGKVGIAFFTSPYSMELVDCVDPFVPAYKIGSGDITWIDLIEYVAKKNKPCLIATGASTHDDVIRAADSFLAYNQSLCLMQCNTNYTASLDNFHHINLNVLKYYGLVYPNVILGLSDHTPGHSTVLGAIALGAKIIEKHFTDDNDREGPDHKFAMNPMSWREMVERSVEVQYSLGNGIKKVEINELNSSIVQRRSLCARVQLEAGHRIVEGDLISLRPSPAGAVQPFQMGNIINKTLRSGVVKGEPLLWTNLI